MNGAKRLEAQMQSAVRRKVVALSELVNKKLRPANLTVLTLVNQLLEVGPKRD